ncbi:hypothetical protein [Streptomyces roseus]|uniref:hypothetical protein n=1 Tax=Streptomyces roseus TaxID=66430 RepID=UPI001FD76196|nr:hypothetical protein [Streptomyces roseus]
MPARGVSLNQLSLSGTWTASYEQFTVGPGARLAFTYRAKNANLVLGGEDTVSVLLDVKESGSVHVHGAPTLYRPTNDTTPRQRRL